MGAFEGIMIHFEPIAAYNDNWRLYQNDFLAREHNTMLEVLYIDISSTELLERAKLIQHTFISTTVKELDIPLLRVEEIA